MRLIEKMYTVIIFASVMIGILLGTIPSITVHAEALIVPLLIGMLYITFLQIPLEDIKASFKNRKFTFTAVIINFVFTPVLAWLLALAFLADHPALMIGFIMLMVTPCTDWYLIFTGIARGNVALSATILPLNLLLQILLLPVYLLIFGGTTGVINIGSLLKGALTVLIIPLLLAVLTNLLLRKYPTIKGALFERISALPMLFLSLAIAAMFASQGTLLLNNLELLWEICIPILLFFVINFFLVQKIGRFITFPYADRASLSLTTLARNSPIALAIALTSFPNEPLIALTLVIGPLLELPILALITQVLLITRKKEVIA